ncbi:MAG: aminoacyl-tRNA hydrolase [Candidatus Omnitrophica bacterium]|nr:aminoacyl-tRNA hydrolase [Candidatus Omnitrophota bacterium]
MKLIVGLGNPGDEYKLTRHNMGFLVLEEFARANDMKFKINRRFNALVSEGIIGREKAFLAMPQTFMNLSGNSVRSMLSWLKTETGDMFVVMDDIALPFGAIRIKPKGSSGGHNGLNSIIDFIGGQEFSRMRIGILGRKNVKDFSSYVLDRFTKAEQKNLPEILKTASQACECWIRKGVNTAMNKFNKYGG